MDVDHVMPFLTQTIDVFRTMVGVKPESSPFEEKSSPNGTYDISAIIGVSGSGAGGIVLSFPERTACRAVSMMLDEEHDTLDVEVSDAVGELINIITGNAKRDLVRFGYRDISLSLPHVVLGSHRAVWRSCDMPCMLGRLTAEGIGEFAIEVNIRPVAGA